MSKFESYLKEEQAKKMLKYGLDHDDKCDHCKTDIRKGSGGTYKGEKNLCDDCMEEVEMSMTEAKERYKGTFNWHGERHTLYSHAASEAQAKNFMIRQLAKKLGSATGPLYNYFRDKGNSWKVEKD